jgi:hypothetical protein
VNVDLRPDRHALLELEALLKEIATLRAEGNAARFNDDARYRWVLHPAVDRRRERGTRLHRIDQAASARGAYLGQPL